MPSSKKNVTYAGKQGISPFKKLVNSVEEKQTTDGQIFKEGPLQALEGRKSGPHQAKINGHEVAWQSDTGAKRDIMAADEVLTYTVKTDWLK